MTIRKGEEERTNEFGGGGASTAAAWPNFFPFYRHSLSDYTRTKQGGRHVEQDSKEKGKELQRLS
jgi:hypothetical protein